MKLHVFNPEHDIALAVNLANFTAPHAGRALRADLGFIPALWADDGDAILVDSIELAQDSFSKLEQKLLFPRKTLVWVTKDTVSSLDISAVEPWGWDLAIRAQLLRYGVSEQLLPNVDEINAIRSLSHRRHAALLLRQLQMKGTTGVAFYCQSFDEIEEKLIQYNRMMLKAPWSSSGRGLRLVEGNLTASQHGWISHLLHTQGGVMAEPYYPKVMDFGMEFYSDGCGHVSFLGLSLFKTTNGIYVGNLLASEDNKRVMLSHYVPMDMVRLVREEIVSYTGAMFKDMYSGPFGVDMMICEDGLLHPCVEINLRRTMGHVALSLSPYVKSGRMSISGKYPFRLSVDEISDQTAVQR